MSNFGFEKKQNSPWKQIYNVININNNININMNMNIKTGEKSTKLNKIKFSKIKISNLYKKVLKDRWLTNLQADTLPYLAI